MLAPPCSKLAIGQTHESSKTFASALTRNRVNPCVCLSKSPPNGPLSTSSSDNERVDNLRAACCTNGNIKATVRPLAIETEKEEAQE